MGPPLPSLDSPDFYMEPSVQELTIREANDCCYCSRVSDFIVGRVGYGHIRFLGNTDVRWLNLDQIIKFDRHSVSVYHEGGKPPVGHGLNKTAEVTLVLRLRSLLLSGRVFLGRCSVVEAEARGAWEGARAVRDHFPNSEFVLEGEARTVVDWCQPRYVAVRPPLVRDLLISSGNLLMETSHVLREGNQVADAMAKRARVARENFLTYGCNSFL